MIHYGGDSGVTADYRKGWLYLYNNTIVSYRTDRTALLRMSSADERADVRNNIVYTAAAAGSTLALLEEQGTIDWKRNWTKAGWIKSFSNPDACTINDDGTSITGTAPGFVDEAGQDFHLQETSACTNAAIALHADVLPTHNVTMEYVKHQTGRTRPTIATLDIGALEGPGVIIPPVEVATASLPTGAVGAGYSQTLAATGGVPPLSWTVESGALPAGLSLSSASIMGTPTTAGTYGFTVKATDSGGVPRTDTRALSILVSPAAPPSGDSDGDGLADEWEILHFGNLTESGAGDADSDGWSNLAEQDLGTDPSYNEPQPMYLAAAEWQSVGLGGGGAQYHPTPAPNNPNLMYGVCDMGGFYRSVDGGRHWEMVNGKYVNGVPGYRRRRLRAGVQFPERADRAVPEERGPCAHDGRRADVDYRPRADAAGTDVPCRGRVLRYLRGGRQPDLREHERRSDVGRGHGVAVDRSARTRAHYRPVDVEGERDDLRFDGAGDIQVDQRRDVVDGEELGPHVDGRLGPGRRRQERGAGAVLHLRVGGRQQGDEVGQRRRLVDAGDDGAAGGVLQRPRRRVVERGYRLRGQQTTGTAGRRFTRRQTAAHSGRCA